MTPAQPLTGWLHPDIRMVWIGDDVVVLSIADDSYACLVGAAEHIVRTGDDAVRTSSLAVLEDLKATGWVTLAQPADPPRRPVAPTRELAEAGRAPLGGALRAAAHAFKAHTGFHAASFPQLIETARRFKQGPPSQTEPVTPGVAAAVRSFVAVRPWLPLDGVCLHRAFLLLSALRAEGIVADWVFGVRIWPFAAHCWVQIGETVLADRLSRVQGYTPILVI